MWRLGSSLGTLRFPEARGEPGAQVALLSLWSADVGVGLYLGVREWLIVVMDLDL